MTYNFDQYTPAIGDTNYPADWNSVMELLDSIFDTSAVFAAGQFTSVGIGTTNVGELLSSAKIHVVGSITTKVTTSAADPCAGLWNNKTAGDNSFAVFYTEGTPTIRGFIDYNRAGGAVRFSTTSDGRLKNNFAPLSDVGSIIDALVPGSYDWDASYQAGATGVGFKAQEVYPWIPNAVVVGDEDASKRPGDDGFKQWGMDLSKLVPYLWAEVKSIRTRVAALEGA